MKKNKHIFINIALLLAVIYALGVCFYIEILNHKHNSFLPKDMTKSGNRSWRYSPITDEIWWRQSKSSELGLNYKTVGLSTEQKLEMERDINWSESWNQFHNVVAHAVFFYLVLPLIFIASFVYIIFHEKLGRFAVFPVVTILLCMVSFYFMFSRGYFTAIMID